jgi:hypothetical protein
MSYSQRPITLPIPQPGGKLLIHKVQYHKDAPQAAPQLIPKMWPTGATSAPARFEFPKLAKLKAAAIFSDINAGEGRLVVGHKNGLNVLFNSGGAKWVDITHRADFGGSLNQPLKTLINGQTGYGSGYDATQIQIWMSLDRQ